MTFYQLAECFQKLEQLGAIKILTYPGHSRMNEHTLKDVDGLHFLRWHDTQADEEVNPYQEAAIVKAMEQFAVSKGFFPQINDRRSNLNVGYRFNKVYEEDGETVTILGHWQHASFRLGAAYLAFSQTFGGKNEQS
jgi:hypothetical protein